MLVTHVPADTAIETARVMLNAVPAETPLWRYWRQTVYELSPRGRYSVQQRDGKWVIMEHL